MLTGQGAPSRREMKIGQAFPSPDRPDTGRIAPLGQFGTGFVVGRPLCYHLLKRWHDPTQIHGLELSHKDYTLTLPDQCKPVNNEKRLAQFHLMRDRMAAQLPLGIPPWLLARLQDRDGRMSPGKWALPNTGGLELRRFGENRATALGETFQSVCDVNAENYICRNTESFGKCPFEIR